MERTAKMWVEEYGTMLFHYAASKVRDRETARDLVQDTLVSAWQKRHTLEDLSREKNWLYTILKHKLTDYYRSRRLSTDSLDDSSFMDKRFTPDGHWKERVESWKQPDKVLLRTEFRAILDRCIAALPMLHQQIFTFHEDNGIPGRELCDILNISPQNFWTASSRARQKLRECLTINWFGGKR